MLLVFCVFDDDNHGVHRADTAQALARLRRLVASHEATKPLHRVMWLVSYETRGMVVAFIVDYITFYLFVD